MSSASNNAPSAYKRLHRKLRSGSADFKELRKRMEEWGYTVSNGYEDHFLDEMIEIFKPWLEKTR